MLHDYFSDNPSLPTFPSYTHIVRLSPFKPSVIDNVKAFDKDNELCADQPACPCGEISYRIDRGNSNNAFNINTQTGDIQFNPESSLEHGNTILTIAASNKPWLDDTLDDGFESVVILKVIFDEHSRTRGDNMYNEYSQMDDLGLPMHSEQQLQTPHHRSKRAAVGVALLHNSSMHGLTLIGD